MEEEEAVIYEKWSGRKRRQRRHEAEEDGAIRLLGDSG